MKRTVNRIAEQRSKFIALRLTETEYGQLRTQMENEGYRSISRYVRERLLVKRTVIRKDVVLTDRALRNQINNLSMSIAKIGANYNQVTKIFNGLGKKTRGDGSPVINARSADFYLKQLSGLTLDLKRQMEHVIETVSAIERDSSPHEGEAQ